CLGCMHSFCYIDFSLGFSPLGRSYVFVFGGRSVSSMVLQDPVFLCPETLSLVQVEVVGCGPSSRHSHSSCGWKDGTIIST
ncbi:hypothetical protein GDO86_005402, partial [Hymenochirus boettgeri]